MDARRENSNMAYVQNKTALNKYINENFFTEIQKSKSKKIIFLSGAHIVKNVSRHVSSF